MNKELRDFYRTRATPTLPATPADRDEAFSCEELEDSFSDAGDQWDEPLLSRINSSEEDKTRVEKDTRERKEDLTHAYFKSLGDISLLTRDEETTLARRIEEGNALIKRILSTMSACPDLSKECYVSECGNVRLRGERQSDKDKGESIEVPHYLVSQKGCEHLLSSPGLQIDEFRMKIEMIDRAKEVVAEARKELICRNLRLVINIAKHYVGRGLPLLDLIQEGNLGLIKAIEKFDFRKGFKFSTCATWWIRQAITKALLDQVKTIRVPANVIEFYSKVASASKKLFSELGREPDTEEIAEKMGISREKVEGALRAVQDPIALETTIGDGDATLEDFIGDTAIPSPCSDIEKNNLTEGILRILQTLTQKESIVIRMRFGIGTDRSFTLSEIGSRLSITCERVRQIEATAMRKLKHPIRMKLLGTLTTS